MELTIILGILFSISTLSIASYIERRKGLKAKENKAENKEKNSEIKSGKIKFIKSIKNGVRNKINSGSLFRKISVSRLMSRFKSNSGLRSASSRSILPKLHLSKIPKIRLKSPSIKLPKFMAKTKDEDKIKEINGMLDAVVSEGYEKGRNYERRLKTIQLDDIFNEASNTISSDLSSDVSAEDMNIDVDADFKDIEVSEKDFEIQLPEMEDLEQIDMDLETNVNMDLGVVVEDMDSEENWDTLELEEEPDEEFEPDIEKIEFDDKDDLLTSLKQEIIVKDEDKIDLLRDLKGQNFDVYELERNLISTLEKIKVLQR